MSRRELGRFVVHTTGNGANRILLSPLFHPISLINKGIFGAGEWIRTTDLLITNQLLCQAELHRQVE